MTKVQAPLKAAGRARAIAAYAGLFLAQTTFSVYMAHLIHVPQERLWPYAVGALVMTVVLARLTWQRERRIKLVVLAATLAALVFVFVAAVLASLAGVSGGIRDAGIYLLYMFGVTGEAWVAFILCVIAAAIGARSPHLNQRYPGRTQ